MEKDKPTLIKRKPKLPNKIHIRTKTFVKNIKLCHNSTTILNVNLPKTGSKISDAKIDKGKQIHSCILRLASLS